MKISLFILLTVLITMNIALARKVGETEITTDDGIEVFQNEKYYLLNTNVKIVSDSFKLSGDKIKIFFNNDLYDINIIDGEVNIKLESEIYKINANSEKLIFKVENEEINLQGLNSRLITDEIEMFSDEEINVNNSNGNFYINGLNSALKSDTVLIQGKKIEGVFDNSQDTKEIIILNVFDEDLAYTKTNNTDMYANIINYNRKNSLIELENNVKIIRDGEIITGDYGTLNMDTNSYKVKSKDSKKVKVIISNQDE